MPDYYSVIACAVSRLPSDADEARHAIYARARRALRETLATLDPTVLANEEAALDAAVATVEMDLLFKVMQGFVRERTAPSFAGLSFVSKVKAFVGAATTILTDCNRLMLQRTLDALTTVFLTNRKGVKRLLSSGIHPLLRYSHPSGHNCLAFRNRLSGRHLACSLWIISVSLRFRLLIAT